MNWCRDEVSSFDGDHADIRGLLLHLKQPVQPYLLRRGTYPQSMLEHGMAEAICFLTPSGVAPLPRPDPLHQSKFCCHRVNTTSREIAHIVAIISLAIAATITLRCLPRLAKRWNRLHNLT